MLDIFALKSSLNDSIKPNDFDNATTTHETATAMGRHRQNLQDFTPPPIFLKILGVLMTPLGHRATAGQPLQLWLDDV